MNIHNEIIIRNYQNNDYNEVNALWEEVKLAKKERRDDKKIISDTIKNGGQLILLIDKKSETIIGASWLTTDYRRIYLHHFAIKTEFQGKGYSHILVKESLKFAKKRKMQIKLEVRTNNYKAINLYKKNGFKNLGDYDIYIIRDYS